MDKESCGVIDRYGTEDVGNEMLLKLNQQTGAGTVRRCS